MTRSLLLLLGMLMGVWLGPTPAATQERQVNETIVYIECRKDNSSPWDYKGSGVVVSPDGHVLTAAHVIPSSDQAECQGSIGVADSNRAERLVKQPTIEANVDAALFQFARIREYNYMPYCDLKDWMIRRKIVAAGFPEGTQTGTPSYREGVLSTVRINPAGIIETDSQTIRGMSGGPVFSKNLAGLVGIVIGAKIPSLGLPSYYGVLPLHKHAQIFNLEESDKPCYRQSREVDFSDGKSQWVAGDGPVRLGVSTNEGVCFLGRVWGQFNDAKDTVGIDVDNSEYVLDGVNKSGGQHGASARCVWYDQ